ncbi:mitochondrial co-chaperone-like protein GrpE [Neohortaea acidophila]|uniref:GrpE protein homolog n=1 Tax=Neohortaea acidophila TaxID=245834 RepID=A0A6A6PGF2_9PEZI|nr:mitochondrial co-chaperone-like protein GrpE [Neohortaea acidophila]KAF2479052.1 mitochondrial co-chaperone-like protein GrpE [Neohortaea acidophila]
MLQQRLSRSLQALARQPQQHQPLIRLPRSNTSSSPFAFRSFAPVASQRLPARRWYSSAQEAEAKKEEPAQDSTPEQQKKAQEATKEDPVQKELEAKKREVIDLTDRLKRSVAEYRNLQEQTKREIQAAKDFALQRFSKDLLDSVDNLDRALINVPADKLVSENQDLVNLHSGLKMTEDILMQTLKKHGLERFDPSEKGEKFDPNKHEAVFQTPMKDKEDGTAFHTQSKGFLLNGRVIRPAKVGVVKNS